MNSRRLHHFLAVYEHRSFGRAAEELHVTQPALSKSVLLLEQEFHVKLFERTATGVVPTLYGDRLAASTRIIEAEMQNAAREIATLSGAIKGEVVVGVTPSVAADLIPRTLERLQSDRLGITVSVIEGLMEYHVPALRRGELDLVVGGWIREEQPDLTSEHIMSDSVQIFAGAKHSLAAERDVSLEVLLNHPWALPPPTQFWMHVLAEKFSAHGLQPPQASAVTNSAGFIKGMLLQNRYLSALPSRLMIHELEQGSLVELAVPELALSFDVSVTYRRQDVRSSAFDMLLTHLKKAAQS